MTIEQLRALSEQDLFQALINVDKPLEALRCVHLSEAQAISIKYGQSINLAPDLTSGLEQEKGC